MFTFYIVEKHYARGSGEREEREHGRKAEHLDADYAANNNPRIRRSK